jgi:hypothetical protein
MALAGGSIWGAAVLCVGLLNVLDHGYGTAFLQMLSSVYPWFHASGTIISVIVGTLWGVLDGALTGFVFAWLYNQTARLGYAGRKGQTIESKSASAA